MSTAFGSKAAGAAHRSVRRMVRHLRELRRQPPPPPSSKSGGTASMTAEQVALRVVMECRNNAELLYTTPITSALSSSPGFAARALIDDPIADQPGEYHHHHHSHSDDGNNNNNTMSETRRMSSPLTVAEAEAEQQQQQQQQQSITPPAVPRAFVEVASERDVKQNFSATGALSGVTLAVSDALEVRQFRTRSGLDTPMFHAIAPREFPLIRWMRRHGAEVVGKVRVRTPLALKDGCVFGEDKPASIAVVQNACHYAISCSLHGPASIACAACHDVVAFKPTHQTFGTFTEQFKLRVPFMSVGLTARRVDDVLFLWQTYTAAMAIIPQEEKVELEGKNTNTNNTSSEKQLASTAGGHTAGHHGVTSALPEGHNTSVPAERAHVTQLTAAAAVAGGDAAHTDTHVAAQGDADTNNTITTTTSSSTTAQANHNDADADEDHNKQNTTSDTKSPTSSSSEPEKKSTQRHAAPAQAVTKSGTLADVEAEEDVADEDSVTGAQRVPRYARPEILDHNPYNYTVKDRRGHIADIDVGWRDYNAEWNNVDQGMPDAFANDGNVNANRYLALSCKEGETEKANMAMRLLTRSMSVLRTVMHPAEGRRQRRRGFGRRGGATRVELAVGYPAEWIDAHCAERYGSSHAFHRRLTDSAYYRSALHRSQRLEVVPVAFDFDLASAVEACVTIANYELFHAFKSMLLVPTDSAGGLRNTHSTSKALTIANTSNTTATATTTSSSTNNSSVGDVNEDEEATAGRGNTFMAMSGLLEAIPAEVIAAIEEGRKITRADYHDALRVRDDVVRATEEQFQDVDLFVLPMLSAPYESNNIWSISPCIPFHLAGYPLLSVQMDENTPVVLVGELGRDAALLEDAFRFLQFVRGVSPRWWRQKIFGTDKTEALQ